MLATANKAAAQEQQSPSSPPLVSTTDTSVVVTAEPFIHAPKTPSATSTATASLLIQDNLGYINDQTHYFGSSASKFRSSECESTRDQIGGGILGFNQTSNSALLSLTEASRGIKSIGTATSFTPNGRVDDLDIQREMDVGVSGARGRGRARGRPRGSGRGRGGAKKASRTVKREREDEDDANDSDTSEVYAPIATITKSGRSVQKPTSYVPPPTSPVSSTKRKKPYRKNPESAVCKICMRGTSPPSNMIVFCDGCNTPYHRFCHHPPIDQTVIVDVDKEWYCRQCEKKRLVPVPDSEVADFVSAAGSPIEERQKYFSRLKPGALVTLLTRASTLQPSLPLFDPEFAAKHATNRTMAPPGKQSTTGSMGSLTKSLNQSSLIGPSPLRFSQNASQSTLKQKTKKNAKTNNDDDEDDGDEGEDDDDNEGYSPSFHPSHYPTPGQGLMATLPPDKDDDEWLVDNDDKSGAIVHFYRDDANTANEGIEEAHRKMDKDA